MNEGKAISEGDLIYYSLLHIDFTRGRWIHSHPYAAASIVSALAYELWKNRMPWNIQQHIEEEENDLQFVVRIRANNWLAHFRSQLNTRATHRTAHCEIGKQTKNSIVVPHVVCVNKHSEKNNIVQIFVLDRNQLCSRFSIKTAKGKWFWSKSKHSNSTRWRASDCKTSVHYLANKWYDFIAPPTKHDKQASRVQTSFELLPTAFESNQINKCWTQMIFG